MLALTDSLGELEIRVEDEPVIVEQVHHQRHVGRGDEQRAALATAVKVPVLRVHRNREQAARPPFEAALRAVGEFDLGRARAFEHVDDFFVEMPDRRRRPAGRQFEQEHAGEIAAPVQMTGRALHAEARPGRRFDVEEIESVILDDRDAFCGNPVEIGIDACARLARRFAHVSALPNRGAERCATQSGRLTPPARCTFQPSASFPDRIDQQKFGMGARGGIAANPEIDYSQK